MAAEGKAAEVVPNTATAGEVADWLRTYDDGDWADLAEKFKGVRGRHLHGYSETQLKEFCGGPRGAALYNVLHPAEAAAGGGAGGGSRDGFEGVSDAELELAKLNLEIEKQRVEIEKQRERTAKQTEMAAKQTERTVAVQLELERVARASSTPHALPDSVFYDNVKDSIGVLELDQLPCAPLCDSAAATWVFDARPPEGTPESEVQEAMTTFWRDRSRDTDGLLHPVDTHSADVIHVPGRGRRRPDHTFVGAKMPWSGIDWQESSFHPVYLALTEELKAAGGVAGGTLSAEDMGRFLSTAALALAMLPARRVFFCVLHDMHALRVLKVEREERTDDPRFSMTAPVSFSAGGCDSEAMRVLFGMTTCKEAALGLEYPTIGTPGGTALVLDEHIGRGATADVYSVATDSERGIFAELENDYVADRTTVVAKVFRDARMCSNEQVALRRLVGCPGVPALLYQSENTLLLTPRGLRRAKARDLSTRFLRSTVSILCDVHERGICHGDVRYTNLLVSGDNQPLLIDFSHHTGRDEPCTSTKVRAIVSAVCLLRGLPEPESSDVSGQIADFVGLGLLVLSVLRHATEGRRSISPPDWGLFLRDASRYADFFAAAVKCDRGRLIRTVGELATGVGADIEHVRDHAGGAGGAGSEE
mmetsp:Transcript_59691/g.144186  ORF Transcript_59691/g.144186 Transcript_59691/m.144186 type:complete len:648 (+) Transcript_59691:87-2030(+)